MVNFEHRFESKRMQKTHIRFFRVWTISHQKAMNWKLNQYCNLIVTIHDVLLSELQHLIGARNDFLPKEYLDTIRMPGRILEPVKLKIYRSFHQLNGILSLKTRSSQFIYRSDNFLWIFSAQICSLYSWIYRLIVYSLSHTNHNDAKIIFRYISNKTPTEYEHNIFISYRFWLLEKPT